MIKIIYPNGKVEYQDVRRLTNYDLYLIFGNWATMRYLYTSTTPSGKPVDFYIVYEIPTVYDDGITVIPELNKPFNKKVFDDYGIKVYGTAIVCKADMLDMED